MACRGKMSSITGRRVCSRQFWRGDLKGGNRPPHTPAVHGSQRVTSGFIACSLWNQTATNRRKKKPTHSVNKQEGRRFGCRGAGQGGEGRGKGGGAMIPTGEIKR